MINKKYNVNVFFVNMYDYDNDGRMVVVHVDTLNELVTSLAPYYTKEFNMILHLTTNNESYYGGKDEIVNQLIGMLDERIKENENK